MNELIEQENKEKDENRALHLREEISERREKLKNKEALLDDLVFTTPIPIQFLTNENLHYVDVE